MTKEQYNNCWNKKDKFCSSCLEYKCPHKDCRMCIYLDRFEVACQGECGCEEESNKKYEQEEINQ